MSLSPHFHIIYRALIVATFGEAFLGHLGEDAAEVGEAVVGLAIEGLEFLELGHDFGGSFGEDYLRMTL